MGALDFEYFFRKLSGGNSSPPLNFYIHMALGYKEGSFNCNLIIRLVIH